METTKTSIMLKAGLLLSLLVAFVSSAFSQSVDSVATASLQEDDKFSEILSYIAMGVGTIAVIWTAYFLSNRKSSNSNSDSSSHHHTVRTTRRATR
jgi:hypothetical protein